MVRIISPSYNQQFLLTNPTLLDSTLDCMCRGLSSGLLVPLLSGPKIPNGEVGPSSLAAGFSQGKRIGVCLRFRNYRDCFRLYHTVSLDWMDAGRGTLFVSVNGSQSIATLASFPFLPSSSFEQQTSPGKTHSPGRRGASSRGNHLRMAH